MNGHRVLATVSLTSTQEDGLSKPLPAGTRSLLLRFPAIDDEQPEPIMLGAVLTPRTGTELVPGKDTDVDVRFWSDEARIHATVGASFDLWYGRPVGRGIVTGVLDDLWDPR